MIEIENSEFIDVLAAIMLESEINPVEKNVAVDWYLSLLPKGFKFTKLELAELEDNLDVDSEYGGVTGAKAYEYVICRLEREGLLE
jgi:hypothetical protein